MNIAIQGILGSFHHQVANQFFGKTDLTECDSFVEIPELLNKGKVDAGIMAIENSLAGAILPNYALIDEYNLQIVGEVHFPIHHHLMALEEQDLSDIKEVWSHPMALLQCRVFFRNHPHLKLVESVDTAAVAAQIRDEQLKGIAAIASKKAADIYHLEIIASEIQTRNENYTRFFILNKADQNHKINGANKASLKITTKHLTGSLADTLTVFAKSGLNLSKIQSLPILDEPWNYDFFIDVVYKDYELYKSTIREIRAQGNQVKILGEYLKSQRKYDR